MLKLLQIIIVLAITGLLTACQTSYVSQPSTPLQVVTKADVKPDIYIGDKIEATATVHRFFFFFMWGPGKFADGVNYGSNMLDEPTSVSFWDSVSQAKAAAAYTACTENKADFIICPRYYIIVNDYFFYKTTTAKVFGYKGVLNGVSIPVVTEQPKTEVQTPDLTVRSTSTQPDTTATIDHNTVSERADSLENAMQHEMMTTIKTDTNSK